jgi:mRNA-degrading endonuclease toxin of MazEF toxin-antitoxin module
MHNLCRGQLWLADLGAVRGTYDNIKRGVRPVIVVSNNRANENSPVIHVVPITTRVKRKLYLPTHVFLNGFHTPGLYSHSVAACEQVQAINKTDLIEQIGTLSGTQMLKVSLGLAVQFALETDE